MEDQEAIRVGSRKSQLAMIQTNFVIDLLKKEYPDKAFQVETMATIGDKILDKALPKIGEKSLFTKELEFALENDSVDFVVHSLKDLPSTLPSGMVIGAVTRREDPHDAVLFNPRYKGSTLASLPEGSVVGTSSLRRIAQLRKNFPHLKYEDVRGNLNTRLRKLDEDNKYAALILAVAGVKRMDWGERIEQILGPAECLYAVGQGALGIEVKLKNVKTLSLLSKISDNDTVVCCAAERAFLRCLEGGCSVPIGVYSQIVDRQLTVTGTVLSLDGAQCLEASLIETLPAIDASDTTCAPRLTKSSICVPAGTQAAVIAAENLGTKLAEVLVNQGAKEILRAAREEKDKN